MNKLDLVHTLLDHTFDALDLGSAYVDKKESDSIQVYTAQGNFYIKEEDIYTRGIIMIRKIPGFNLQTIEAEEASTSYPCADAREVVEEIIRIISKRAIEQAVNNVWKEEQEEKI